MNPAGLRFTNLLLKTLTRRVCAGHLFAVISTKIGGDAGVEAVTSGRELIARLHEEYFGDLTAKPFSALDSAVRKVINEFKVRWGDIEIAACAVVGDVVFSSVGGGARVVICRDGAMATILDSSEAVVSASGFPKKGDVMYLERRRFLRRSRLGLSGQGFKVRVPRPHRKFLHQMFMGKAERKLGAVIVKFEESIPSIRRLWRLVDKM